jgi:hypothetical protein
MTDLPLVRVQDKARELATIPEPGTTFLFGSGLAGLAPPWRFHKNTVKV